ncbi:hypothetical protein GUITHDRAFT_107099 [Guillardia theta CCMP2712]|uniref:Uncharacterized protein n=2 Tax=Guillardia theta TaxID=55529 RepID=L1JFT3_GUITC|nr:hypothetical protein GUITHDRAFT_107099 [Guillardia theta CCMP2712]EKX47187.1 hypothetical protein GUITHDRAFT_107099 [Guillardia theta CCMP2712]|eukprot:XP_005834167.1 hypothetical protein GUITHDRAFT_107099 [Guillardia theta CCMP2712]
MDLHASMLQAREGMWMCYDTWLSKRVQSYLDVGKSFDGSTGAHVASSEGHMEVLRYLGEVGGRELLAQADEAGRTCAHYASKGEHVEVLKYLEEVCGLEIPD